MLIQHVWIVSIEIIISAVDYFVDVLFHLILAIFFVCLGLMHTSGKVKFVYRLIALFIHFLKIVFAKHVFFPYCN